LTWTALAPGTGIQVEQSPANGWGPLSYAGGPWGASAANSVRPGAEALVTAGGHVLVARWNRGHGRVVWSGMNLFAHATQSDAAAEDAFIVDQASWLLPAAGSAQVSLQPQWTNGEQAVLDLPASEGPALVLFKESTFPGWSARLVTPSGSQAVRIDDGEMDFMLVHLDSVPAGSRLVFSYAPTPMDEAWWASSVLAVLALGIWLLAPGAVAAFGALARRPAGVVRWRWAEEDV
jgi:hypothetical protein